MSPLLPLSSSVFSEDSTVLVSSSKDSTVSSSKDSTVSSSEDSTDDLIESPTVVVKVVAKPVLNKVLSGDKTWEIV